MDVYKTFLKTASEYKDKPALVFEGDVITFLNALKYVTVSYTHLTLPTKRIV